MPLFTDDTTATSVADTSFQTPAPLAPCICVELPTAMDIPKDEAVPQPALPPAALSPATDDTDCFDQINADSITQPVTQIPVIEKDSLAAVTPPLAPAAATSFVDSKIVKLSYYVRDRHRLTQLLNIISSTDTSQQEKIAALLDWAEQQLSHSREEDSQPITQLDSQHSVASSEVTPGAGQLVDVAVDQTPALSDSTPESSPKPASPSPSPLELLVARAVTDQARTLGVLSSRVETLETQLAVLQQERDRALGQLAQLQAVPSQLQHQLEHLQAQNSQLRCELDRFEAIRRAFLSEEPLQEPTVSPKPAPTLIKADTAPTPVITTTQADSTSNGAIAQLQSQSTPTHKSSPFKAKATSSDRPRRKGQAKARAENIFHALIAWNGQQER